MGLFDFIFGVNKEPQPNISFGRYSDAYRDNKQQAAWDKAIHFFENDNFIEACRHLLLFLQDEKEGNVKFEANEDNSIIHFELLQGSKKLVGIINSRKVEAEAKIAKCEQLNVGFMRRLMERNYGLKYGRFALDDNDDITMKFDTHTIDGSPYKLYYALKEIATHADKLDDLLVEEFDDLKSINTGHIKHLDEQERTVKCAFIKEEIQKVFHYIDTKGMGKLPGGIAYLLLHASYKLDFLTKPEGFMMEDFERIHRLYFARDEKTIFDKSVMIRKELTSILERDEEDLKEELYQVISTFGITAPVGHERVVGFIDGELSGMDWYKDNEYPEVAVAIVGYIVGFCLFNHAIPRPDKAYFLLFYEITEAAYFKALGFTYDYYSAETKKLNRSAIKERINEIARQYRKDYPKLAPNTSLLNFENLPEFVKSFMIMIKNLNLEEK